MKAFLEVKQKLLQSDFLVHYDLQKPVILCCDAIPAELMLKRSPRTRLSLLRPEDDSELREAQSQQYDTASGRVRQLEPWDDSQCCKSKTR